MQSRSLRHVSVWLDDGSSDGQIFAHALEWAFRLNLPLQAVITSPRFANGLADQGVRVEPVNGAYRSHGPVVDKMKSWGVACAERGIVLEMFLSLEGGEVGVAHFLRPHGLCVFLANGPSPRQEELFRQSARSQDLAVLMCPPASAPMSRILVLQQQAKPSSSYLESAARLCQAIDVHPVILIVADTEREANLRQGFAQAVCNSFQLLADFDFVIGCDLPSAVRRVASWRSCSHAIIERRPASSWWKLTNVDLLEQLRELSECLSILALPESFALEAPQKIRGNSLGLTMSQNGESKRKWNAEYV